jgi:hypothetical protein
MTLFFATRPSAANFKPGCRLHHALKCKMSGMP